MKSEGQHSPGDGGRPGDLWGIVLAGGEGVRLRPLIRRLYRDERPKQFATLFGSRSLLHRTLDRISATVSAHRTVVVTLRSHERFIHEAFNGRAVPTVLVQPEDRGTAAGVLFPTRWIHWRDPEAVVAVFPSDHFVSQEEPFMGHVAEVAALVRDHPDWIVLLGAQPTEAEPDYGWIEPGDLLERTVAGPIHRVRAFREKPSVDIARACLEGGWLWNTFVFVATARTLIETAGKLLPLLDDRLSLIAPFVGTASERWAVGQAYALAQKASFSRSVLELTPPGLVVSRLPALTWSDWGTPERVVKSLKAARLLPASLEMSDLPALRESHDLQDA